MSFLLPSFSLCLFVCAGYRYRVSPLVFVDTLDNFNCHNIVMCPDAICQCPCVKFSSTYWPPMKFAPFIVPSYNISSRIIHVIFSPFLLFHPFGLVYILPYVKTNFKLEYYTIITQLFALCFVQYAQRYVRPWTALYATIFPGLYLYPVCCVRQNLSNVRKQIHCFVREPWTPCRMR